MIEIKELFDTPFTETTQRAREDAPKTSILKLALELQQANECYTYWLRRSQALATLIRKERDGIARRIDELYNMKITEDDFYEEY